MDMDEAEATEIAPVVVKEGHLWPLLKEGEDPRDYDLSVPTIEQRCRYNFGCDVVRVAVKKNGNGHGASA